MSAEESRDLVDNAIKTVNKPSEARDNTLTMQKIETIHETELSNILVASRSDFIRHFSTINLVANSTQRHDSANPKSLEEYSTAMIKAIS